MEGVVGVGQRRAEVGHDPVADELVQGAAVLEHPPHHVPVVLVEHAYHLVGRELARQGREPADVGEQHRDLLSVRRAGAGRLVGEALGHRRREVAPEPLALALLGRHPPDERPHPADQVGGSRRRAPQHDHRRDRCARPDAGGALEEHLADGGRPRHDQHLPHVESERAEQHEQHEEPEREASDAPR